MISTQNFIEQLYREYYDVLWRYVYHIVHDKEMAEDVVQETFFEVYKKAEELKNHENIQAWLFVAVKYKMMKIGKKEQKMAACMNIEKELLIFEECYEHVTIHNALKQNLSSEEYGIVTDFYEYGYSSKEIAEKLGISDNCFRTRMCRVREKMKKILSN